MMTRLFYGLILALAAPAAALAVDFEEDIFPILEDMCFHCHDEDKQKSGLRLDHRVGMLKGGDSGFAAIVPGDPEKSYLMEVIQLPEEDEVSMPPKDGPLYDDEIALIKEWIEQGAVWPGQMDDKVEDATTDHWSFQPVERPEVPAETRNPIDAFLEAKLAASDIEANGPADALSLARRTAIILTGIPPTPERAAEFEVAFAKDPNAAHSALVDELLASQHFGERWAQHWLDVIRWAETNGSEANLYRKNAWVYRDYVIRAFNEDLPYDQFIRDQIAGDSYGSGEATGFLVSGPHVPAATVGREPSAIRQARSDRMDEIMQTVGASMMGLTMNCARCHNHKFDPISIQDYYSMTAVFQDIEFGSRYPEFSADHPRKKAANAIWAKVRKPRAVLKANHHWEEDWGGYREAHFPKQEAAGVRITFMWGGAGLDEMEVFGPIGEHKNFAAASAGATVESAPDMEQTDRNPPANAIDGEYGTMSWRAKSKDKTKKPWIEVTFAEPQQVGRVRMSSNREYFFDTDYLDKKPGTNFGPYMVSVRKADGTLVDVANTQHFENQCKDNPELAAARDEMNLLAGQLNEEGPRPSFVARFVEPVATKVLHRGSPENPRDEVYPAAPKILQGDLALDSSASGAQRRKDFAEWLAATDNPLTARVMTNRLWHHVFGAGLVPTTSDFGIAGMVPSHPELLDWLASEFAQPQSSEVAPWSMKSMIRLLVTSDAFRRSSAPSESSALVDAGAALLWRYPPRRVEAEVIRDGILQASDKLDRTIGGRSYRIHNVKKTYAQWEVVDNYSDQTWRRMIYQERMRRVDDKIFTAFDFPDCGQVRAKRPVSTTPLQALNLMNSDFVVEQAKHIAERAGNVERAFELLLLRKPDADERAICDQIAAENGLEVVCRSLMNSNEFAFMP